MSDEREVYLQLRDIQTTHAFLPGKIPALCGKAADEIEWLRENTVGLSRAMRELQTDNKRLWAMLSWIEDHDPQIVEAAREKFALAGKEEE